MAATSNADVTEADKAWRRLLSQDRLGRRSKPGAMVLGRTEFQRDYDRIVFSSPFRRLQNKTQVFPMPENDFVHNRLTHSIEVSCVGRSLGEMCGFLLRQHAAVASVEPADIGAIVAAASLAHDIGNPPFGHKGEDIIRRYFAQNSGALLPLTEAEQADFLYFEGNALGFHLLASKTLVRREGGLQLTYATLGAGMKYPWCAIDAGDSHAAYGGDGKSGFFVSDVDSYAQVAQTLGLLRYGDNIWARHPLAFLTEAADDICYTVIDLEDGYDLGWLSYEQMEHLLLPVIQSGFAETGLNHTAIHNELTSIGADGDHEKVAYLRARAIDSLTRQVACAFIARHEALLTASHTVKPLLQYTEAQPALRTIAGFSKDMLYKNPRVIERTMMGKRVIEGLLSIFLHDDADVERLIPAQFRHRDSPYDKLIAISAFVAGMTDRYALSLYRKLSGIEI